MPHAYSWLTTSQKHHIRSVDISYWHDGFYLSYYGDFKFQHLSFKYEKSEDSTLIICKELKRHMVVGSNYFTTFIEDLKAFLDEKVYLRAISVLKPERMQNSGEFEDLERKLADSLKDILQSKSRKLEVDAVDFKPFSVPQYISIIQLLGTEYFKFVAFREIIDTESFLLLDKWKKGNRFDINFKLNHVASEDLSSIKKLLYQPTSSFESIFIGYESIIEEDLNRYFHPWMVKLNCGSFKIEAFQTKIRRTKNLQSELKIENSIDVFGNRIVMKSILENLDFFDIQRLRKVSPAVRLCIDDIKPDPQIIFYEVSVHNKFFKFETIDTTILSKSNASKQILYGRTGETTWKVWGQTFDTEICPVIKDFEVNLKHQESVLSELKMDWNNQLVVSIGKVLQSRKQLLRVSMLSIAMESQNSLMEVLPHLDVTEINSLQLSVLSGTREEKILELELDEVCKLKQWRAAKKLTIKGLLVTTSIQELNLGSFDVVDMKVSIFSMNDIVYLKNEIMNSSSFVKFHINYDKIAIADDFYQEIIPYKRVPDVRTIWFFPGNNSEKFIHVVHHENHNSISFHRVGREDVPEELL